MKRHAVRRNLDLRSVVCSFGVALLVANCSSSSTETPAKYTYHQHIKPLVDNKCAGCHREGDIAPFSLETFADVIQVKGDILTAVSQGVMPPWPPDNTCNTYAEDRSLTDDQKTMLLDWIKEGAPEGDVSKSSAASSQHEDEKVEAMRVDRRLKMSEPYTPKKGHDDYRCFLLEWPETKTKFITGLRVVPQQRKLVHHVIAYHLTASMAEEYRKLDQQEQGSGYTCFGGVGGSMDYRARWLGGWVPGQRNVLTPPETGLKIEPGSVIVIQMHYNTTEVDPAPDQSTLELQLDDQVTHEAVILPFTNPGWVAGYEPMTIPANQASVKHAYVQNPKTIANLLFGDSPTNSTYRIHSALLHMHMRGKSGYLGIKRASGEESCLLRIPEWDFHWQGTYRLKTPITVEPDDDISIECEWDNSVANQPVVDGKPLEPQNLAWGDGSHDEMCLGTIYISK